MAMLKEWFRRFWAALKRDTPEKQMHDEIQMHLELAADELQRRGQTPEDAVRTARLQYGGVAQTMEAMRDQHGLPWLENLGRDVRYALRMLGRTPGFTAVAILTLALGIGANTAIFSLVDAVLLRSLPVKDPHGLAFLTIPSAGGLGNGTTSGQRALLAYSEYLALRDQTEAFSGLVAVESGGAERQEVSWDGGSRETARSKLVTGNYFQVLGVDASRGRLFTSEDDLPLNAHPEVVLSYGYWQNRFGLDPSIIGRTLLLHGHAFTVIGVTLSGFSGETVGDAPDMWFPISMQAQVEPGADLLHDPPGVTRYMWLTSLGRLQPGVSLARAQANVDLVFKRLVQNQVDETGDPKEKRDLATQNLKLSSGVSGATRLSQYHDALYILFALVGLVLLMAIANLASLLLARASTRQREIGVRLALGAGRGRIVRQLLTETVLLAFIGGGAGWLLARWGERLLLSLVIEGRNSVSLDITPDLRVLAFSFALCLLAGLLIGLAPALRATSRDLNSGSQLRTRGATATGIRANWNLFRRGIPLRTLLIIAQVALSVVLISGAALFVRSLQKLENVNLGYDAGGLTLFTINAGSAGYDWRQAISLFRRINERVASIPGVARVSYSGNGLFSHSENGTGISVEGYTEPNGARVGSRYDGIGPGYFSTVGIPLVMGHDIEHASSGAPGALRQAVVNQAFVKKFFENRDPLGRHFTDLYPDDKGATMTIVGVAGDVKYNSLEEEPRPRFYILMEDSLPSDAPQAARYEVRFTGASNVIEPEIIQAIGSVDPNLSAPTMNTMTSLVDESLAPRKVLARLSGFFGVLALLLAAIGLYGVMSYGVARRTNEIGIRMALGALPGVVLRMILGEVFLMVALGIAIGIPASMLASRWVASQLFGVAPGDPIARAAAVIILTAVALVAGFLPARRAANTDPLEALRYE
jgi:putative ABC transport system permease protein